MATAFQTWTTTAFATTWTAALASQTNVGFVMAQEPFTIGCFAIPEGDCDCSGNQFDASGVCGGGAPTTTATASATNTKVCVYAWRSITTLTPFLTTEQVFGIDQSCPADLNGDDSVGSADLLLFLAEYGAECP